MPQRFFDVTKTNSAGCIRTYTKSCLDFSRAKKIKADPFILGDADHELRSHVVSAITPVRSIGRRVSAAFVTPREHETK